MRTYRPGISSPPEATLANIRSSIPVLLALLIAVSCGSKETDTSITVDTNTTCDPQPEVCDGIDNNCDGNIDIGASDATDWYIDRDQDSYGTTLNDAAGNQISPIQACEKPDGYVADNTDCDDVNADINPGATEVVQDSPQAEQFDEDCDGSHDDYDMDLDGWAYEDGDCNDYDPTINPGATEVCNEHDDDCDGGENDGDVAWHRDFDEDGFGDSSYEIGSCTQPDGYISDGTDCDDMNASANPSATEVVNGIDDDCDGQIDE